MWSKEWLKKSRTWITVLLLLSSWNTIRYWTMITDCMSTWSTSTEAVGQSRLLLVIYASCPGSFSESSSHWALPRWTSRCDLAYGCTLSLKVKLRKYYPVLAFVRTCCQLKWEGAFSLIRLNGSQIRELESYKKFDFYHYLLQPLCDGGSFLQKLNGLLKSFVVGGHKMSVVHPPFF